MIWDLRQENEKEEEHISYKTRGSCFIVLMTVENNLVAKFSLIFGLKSTKSTEERSNQAFPGSLGPRLEILASLFATWRVPHGTICFIMLFHWVPLAWALRSFLFIQNFSPARSLKHGCQRDSGSQSGWRAHSLIPDLETAGLQLPALHGGPTAWRAAWE